MTASQIQGWPSLTIKCTSTDYVNRKNQLMYGIIDKTNNQNIQKTYTISQPHWSLSVRVNIYTLRNFAASDNIQVYMDGTKQIQYQKGTNLNIGESLCLSQNDYLYQFYKNITHSANTFVLAFQSSISTSASTGGFALSELYVEIDTCYPGCQTCSGPANNQCLTCITGAVANNGQCQCTTGFAYQTSCVPTCPAGLRGEPTLLVCVQDYCDASVCATCDNTTKSCTSCKAGFYLLQTQCVASCPTYTNQQGNACQDILPSNGMYLLKALYQTFVSESEIAAGGLTVTGLEGNGFGTVTSSGAYTSVCNGVYYIGGYMLAASNASFKRTFTGLPPHSQIRVGFTFVAIDDWDSEYIYINYDGQQASNFMVNIADTVDALCGLQSFLDLVYNVDKTAIHTSPTLNLEIKATLSLNSSQKSYGLRNLFVILIQCSQWCISCNPTTCLQCDITHYLYKGSCYVTCPTTTYIDQNRECHDCDASCATCSGPNNTDCITCPPGKLLYNNGGWTCVSNCPATNYYSDGTKCQKCDSSCLTCSGGANNNCQTCNAGVFLYQNQCLASCPSNTFVSGTQCVNCDGSCKTCTGASNQQCASCDTTYLLTQGTSKSCVSNCGNSLYPNTTNHTCSSCDSTCFNCSGPNPNQCTQCTGNRYLQGNQCLLTCNPGFYAGANNMCVACDQTCATCSAGANTNCLSCQLPLYLNGNQCLNSCNSNQYKDDPTASCLSCDSSCLTCQGAGPKNCTSCPASTFLNVDHSCVSKCPDGLYADGNVCKACPSQCAKCVIQGTSPVCTTCPPSQALYNGNCVATCPAKTYQTNNGATNICSSCDSSCQTCSGPNANQCLSCILPNYFQPDTTQCVTTCKTSYYPVQNTATCAPCNATCYQCSASTANDCTSCTGNLYLQNNTCSSTCQNGTYPDKTTNKCTQCDSTCLTCSAGTNTDCLTCSPPNYLQTDKNSCLTTCKSNEYQDNSSNKCVACNVLCATCSGPASTQCLTCQAGQILYTSPDNKKTCVNSCPDGYYSDTKNNVCAQCNSSCLTCASPGDNKSCLSCAPTLYLLNGQCVNSCPQKYYSTTSTNPQTMICKQCYQDCLTCSGPQSTDCKTCQLPNYFVAATSQCLPNCPAKFYKNDPLAQCSACDPSCANCSGPSASQCTSCSGSLYLDGVSCINTCSPGKFANQQNNTCTACDPTCKTCDGTTSTNCLSCALPNYYQLSTKQCVQQCNANQYKDNATISCIACNSTCATCSGPNSNQCLTCNGTDVLINGNTCQSNCPDGQYQDQTVCKACDSSCKTCVFPGSSNKCVTCKTGQYFYQNQCLSKCPNKTFSTTLQDKTLICTDCDQSCQSCSGSLSNNCLSCAGSLFLNSDNTCKPTCIVGQYPNTQNSTCQPCDKSCYQCKGPNSNQCTACQGNSFLDTNASTCVGTCPPKQYANTTNNTCSACHPTCNSCSGPLSSNCTSCSLPNFMQTNSQSCLPTCQLNEYQDQASVSCKACDLSCKTCGGQGPNNCQSCNVNQFLHLGNSCVATCPAGYYSNVNVCSICSKNCQTCNYPGDDSSCTTCKNNQFLYKGQCYQNCPNKTFSQTIQGIQVCTDCDSSCLACNGPTNTNCTQCALPNYLLLSTNSCVQNCPDSFYKNDQLAQCSQCDQSCFQCNGPTANSCTACTGKMYLDNQKCVANCSDGKYKSPTSNICLNCNSSCKTCNPANPNNCLTCTLPLYFQYRDSTCQLTCQPDQYRDNATVSCINCDSSCLTCLGSKNTDCLSCTGTYLQNTQCVNSCSDGYYANKQTQRCENCNRNCKTCFGPDQNSCISCSVPLLFQKSTYSCVTRCDKNYYSNYSTNSCELCHPDCASCSGSLNNQCTSCSGQKYLYQNSCVASCPNGFFAQQNKCQQCTQGCQVCTDGSVNKCLVCMNTYYLYQGQCVKKCPEFFFEDIYSYTCQPCSQNCSQCVNYGSLTCIQCGQGYNLYNNACIKNCPVGTYVDNQVCKDCNIECLTCIGPQDSQCTSCQSGMLLQDNYCVNSCDSNYALIQSQSLCVKCDSSCLTCTGSDKNQCATCPQSSIPFNTQCLTQCPQGFYQIPNQLKCNSCKPYCSKCTNSNDCQACSKGYVMLNGDCLNQCPNQDYFVDSSTNQCTACNDSCKESGCFGPGENDCIVSYIEAKESILFIIFMVKLGYWIFNSISGYFMDKFDEKEHQRKVIQFMKGGEQSRTFNQSNLQQTQEGSVIKRKNRNRFDDQNNLSATEQKNIYSQNNQTIQNMSLNTSTYNNQLNNSKILNLQKVSSQAQMSPLKNQSWRDLPNELSNINNQSYRNNDDSPVKTNQNLNTRRPIIVKRFSFKQEDGCPTFRDQEDQKNSDSQSQSSKIDDTNQPIDLPTNQKLYYSLIGNDLIQVWTLYNPYISRILRATLVYFKFLCFFYGTNIIYKKSPGLLVLSLILGMIIKEAVFIFFIQFAICLRKSAMIAVILLVGSVIVVCTVWFRPEIQKLTTNKDITWSWMYLSIFLVDFIFVQTSLALLRYFSSVRSLENRNDKFQALLDKTLVDQGVIYKIKNES
ncbi:zinc finger lsd1 subclass family protein (macronuclear) [Tetrahymena thermophila SB210]|uniref:Zinc finger lsd1 subclass family protein n=1 Tax=Tetrahymena thermophila (strain SB210) TaxID=312017 RepID=I7MKZ6_TETTS|nr:zinc finger lsd1 subclass family protein [Tetrahymena thermophila SB210]EAS00754.2 zinc finger lsd1 subclass family protein [Tetrahymena thermophila SB210]|eukprot:XP_001020999.2 zinc finger lsd1 subclass family protein [Tetrahymena thermophila SB210]